jgi:hypothetical protein
LANGASCECYAQLAHSTIFAVGDVRLPSIQNGGEGLLEEVAVIYALLKVQDAWQPPATRALFEVIPLLFDVLRVGGVHGQASGY